jgi:hypothetical protein
VLAHTGRVPREIARAVSGGSGRESSGDVYREEADSGGVEERATACRQESGGERYWASLMGKTMASVQREGHVEDAASLIWGWL